MTVTPAADLPEQVGDRKGSDLFIVNLQNTPLDRYATKRLNGKCDEVMKLFMAELGVEVLPWKLHIVVHKGIQIDVIEVESGLQCRISNCCYSKKGQSAGPTCAQSFVEGVCRPSFVCCQNTTLQLCWENDV